MLLICCVLFAYCGMDAISLLDRKVETVYEPTEQRTWLMMPPVSSLSDGIEIKLDISQIALPLEHCAGQIGSPDQCPNRLQSKQRAARFLR